LRYYTGSFITLIRKKEHTIARTLEAGDRSQGQVRREVAPRHVRRKGSGPPRGAHRATRILRDLISERYAPVGLFRRTFTTALNSDVSSPVKYRSSRRARKPSTRKPS